MHDSMVEALAGPIQHGRIMFQEATAKGLKRK